MIRRPPRPPLFPSTPLFRSELAVVLGMVLSGANFALYFQLVRGQPRRAIGNQELHAYLGIIMTGTVLMTAALYADRKSTRLNSSHANISYAVFCLKKKKKNR